ncbi:hypothetical protein JQS43_22080 [Natronosporangium hydrolyticum]|uniref:Uncharacterized protein n=1 Tax=Natronosporangium hydrolyticum TaxID=2811111 RepID=A0A895YDD1_9ACTN|nr:hypothetical protein [Natronosporangium hydrolyticum]QSB14182.1 hypothetical protein JQS43_22080 [Natronosporangium hydrolyticum]
MDSQMVLALSGPDNVGKSTQLRILTRRCLPKAGSAGALHEYDPRWPAIVAGGMATWWFTASSIEELADVLAASYLNRHADIEHRPEPQLLDRGVPMLEACLAATISVREGLTEDDAYREALRLLHRYHSRLQAAERRETPICQARVGHGTG